MSPPREQPSSPPANGDLVYYAGETLGIVSGNWIGVICRETSAKPLATITWRLPNGTTLQQGDQSGRVSVIRVTKRSVSLVINAVQLSDMGLYTCIARNRAGQTTADSTLTVYSQTASLQF